LQKFTHSNFDQVNSHINSDLHVTFMRDNIHSDI
jgi:hypothetical protein